VTPASANLKHLQRLCCSGLSGEALVPELLRGLRSVVPSRSNAFMWCDERCEITNSCSEDPVFWDMMPVYLNEFHDRRNREVLPAFSDFMRERPTVTHARRVVADDRRLYGSAWYAHILRRLAWRNVAYTKIRAGAYPLGMLLQGLDSTKPEVTAREAALMLKLAPFIAHGLTHTDAGDAHYADSDTHGLLIFGLRGELLFQTPSASELLFRTTFARGSARAYRRALEKPLPPFVRKLCNDLEAVFAAGEALANAPSYTHSNAWGRFLYQARWLDGPDSTTRAIAVTIELQLPVEVVLLRRIASLGLPPKQADVCFQIARGASHAAIAKTLGTSTHAVNWHLRQIYARLDVHNAAELNRKLLRESS